MILSDRIKYLMKMDNLSAAAFAEKVGVQPSSISHILSGRNKPSLEFIQKILVQFPNISADWLITGNTKIKTDTLPIESEETKQPSPTPITGDKTIKKVMIFYTDNTFEEIVKNN